MTINTAPPASFCLEFAQGKGYNRRPIHRDGTAMFPEVLRRGDADLDDVIVVGAGPAGNNAALGLASRRYAVKVIDSRHNIGEKLCTGIVGQECSRRFPIEDGMVYRDRAIAS